MIIMGLDPSLNCLGWFIFDSEKMLILDYGFIPNKGLEENEKIVKIYNKLSNILKQYKIDAVGIEEEFSSKNPSTLKKLSHVHGSIILLLSQYNIPYTYYSVMTIKSQVLGGMKTKKEDGTKKSGDEMKEEVAAKVFEVFGKQNFYKEYTNDVTDAASVGLCYKMTDGVNPAVERKEKEKAAKKEKKIKEKADKLENKKGTK